MSPATGAWPAPAPVWRSRCGSRDGTESGSSGGIMSRIKLITERTDVGPDRQGEIDAILGTLGHLSGPFAVLMHSPGLAQKVMEAGAHVRLHSTLDRWQRELAILVVAAGKQSDFEWARHGGLA